MRKKLGEVLRDAGLIDEVQLEAALAHQRQFGGHLGRILLDNGFVSEPQLVETLSRLLGVPRVELERRDVPPELLAFVPLDFAEKFLVVPVALRAEAKGEQLFVAMSDPTNLEAVDTLQFQTGKRVVPMIAAEREIEGAIRRWYYGERPREIAPRSLDHVQFPGREVAAPPAEFDEIPVVTGSTLIEDPPAPEPAAPLSGDWFLQLDGKAAAPGAAPTPTAPIAPAMTPATLSPTPSSPFAAAPPATTTPQATPPSPAPPPGAAAPPTVEQPTSSPFAAAPSAREELFGSPNSFLGRDDDTGLGQRDPRKPPVEAVEPLALPDDALTPLPDDALTSFPEPSVVPLPEESVTPLPEPSVASLPEESLTPLPAAPEEPPPPPAEAAPDVGPPAQPHDPFVTPPVTLDPFAPSAPSASGGLPVAKARPDDGADPSAAELKPIEPAGAIAPLELDDDDDTPLELASAADFLHGGPPEAAERGLELDDDGDETPLELASAAEMIAHVDPEAPAAPEPEAPPALDDDGPMLLATAAELAQMSLAPEGDAAPSGSQEPPTMPGFEDLSELTDQALSPLPTAGTPGFDPDVTADLDVGDAGYRELADARARALAEAADARLRPLPPPGGVTPDGGEDDGDAPIEVVNMPPDRRPVAFPAVAAAPKPSPSGQDDFGNPLDGGAFAGEMEALDIEGSEFDADSGEVPVAAAPAPDEPAPLAESDDVEITEDIEVDAVAPPAPLLSAHTIHEMERLGHDGTTTLTAAGLADTAERVAGAAAPGEVMTLALPTPAFSHASTVDAPWHLAGAPPPLGRGPGDVPLAPVGLASSSFANVDDPASLAPEALLARLADLGDAAIALPGRATPSAAAPAALPRGNGFEDGAKLPDTMPVSSVDDGPASLADAWRDAAESQLLHRAHTEDLVMPERRRALEAPPPPPVEEAPRPLHAYTPSEGTPAVDDRPPWSMLVDDKAPGDAAANDADPSDADPNDADPNDADPTDADPNDAEPPLMDLTADAVPLPAVDWAAALDEDTEPSSPVPPPPETVSLPAATPRSVLIADVVHMDDDLTPESSPPQAQEATPPPAPGSVPGGVSFAPTPTMITRMSPEELRALAERLVQRGALTSDDIDAARKVKEAAGASDDEDG